MQPGRSTRILNGLAQLLHSADIGTWRPDDPYEADDIGIVVGDLPPSPDQVIGLRSYFVEAEGNGDEITAVQIRVRGIPNSVASCDDIADAITDHLHYAEPGSLGGIPVTLIWRYSGPVPLGQDGNRRSERTDNYNLHTLRDTAHVSR